MNLEEQTTIQIQSELKDGPVVPRCLAALPTDIETILKEFSEQEK